MKQNDFSITTDIISNICVLHLNGFLDAHTSIILEKQIQSVIKQNLYKIVLDFEKLEYISSAGLGVFMIFIEELRENNGDIVFTNLPENILNVLSLLGFDEIFRISSDTSLAIEIFS